MRITKQYCKIILILLVFVVFIFYPGLSLANHPDRYELLITKIAVIDKESFDDLNQYNKPKYLMYNIKILQLYQNSDLNFEKFNIATNKNLNTGDVFWLIGSARQTDSTWTSQCQEPLCFNGEICGTNEYRQQNIEECTGPTKLTIYPNFLFNLNGVLGLMIIFIILLAPLIFSKKIKSKTRDYYKLIFLISISIILWRIFGIVLLSYIYLHYFFWFISLVSIVMYILGVIINRKKIKKYGLILCLFSVFMPPVIVLMLILTNSV